MSIRALIAVVCVLGTMSDEPKSPPQVDDDAIRELVFRKLLPNRPESGLVYFLAFEKGMDPPKSYLGRFSDLKLRIRPRSQAKVVESADSSQWVFDPSTGDPGVLITVNNPRWIDKTKVEVTGRRYRGPLNASRRTYEVQKVNGEWKITRVTRRAES
jgi:hypothetical protein